MEQLMRCTAGTDQSLPKIIDDNEYEMVIRAADCLPQKGTYWKTALMLAGEMALRSCEVVRVKLEHVDFAKSELTIPYKQKNGTTYERLIMPESVKEQLRVHLCKYAPKISAHQNYLFFSRIKGRGHITTKQVRYMMERIRDLTGITDYYGKAKGGERLFRLSFHTLRHYCLSKVCDNMGVYAAKTIGRHRTILSTMKYMHTSMKYKGEIVNQVFNQGSSQHSALEAQIQELKNLLANAVILQKGEPLG